MCVKKRHPLLYLEQGEARDEQNPVDVLAQTCHMLGQLLDGTWILSHLSKQADHLRVSVIQGLGQARQRVLEREPGELTHLTF